MKNSLPQNCSTLRNPWSLTVYLRKNVNVWYTHNMTSVLITSKWQVTIPEEIRKEVPALEIGQRLRWEVVNGILTARPVRSISELAGCLKSDDLPVLGREEERSAVDNARIEHLSKKYGKA